MKEIHLILNSSCNQKCLFCATATQDDFYISTPGAKLLIDKAIKNGADRIDFSGGEATLRKDLPLLVNYIKEKDKNIYVTLLTNAICLADIKHASPLKNVDSFSISCHGATAKINDALTRSKGNFKKTLAGARIVQRLKYYFSFYFVVTTINFHEIIDFVKLIKKEFPMAASITFSYPYQGGSMFKHPELQPKLTKIIPLLIKAKRLYENKDYSFHISLSSCGLMPLCVAGSLRELILENNRLYNEQSITTFTPSGRRSYLVTNKDFQNDNFVRAKACKKCRYKHLCPGVWKSYFEIYGTGELKAIK